MPIIGSFGAGSKGGFGEVDLELIFNQVTKVLED
jgi:hypothetical protein